MIKCKHCQLGHILEEKGPNEEMIVECRCNPPFPILMPAGVGLDNQPRVMVNFFFPRMAGDSWCGQGIVKIAEVN